MLGPFTLICIHECFLTCGFLSFQMDATYDDEIIDLMANCISLYEEWGKGLAWIAWFECFDINHDSLQFKNNKTSIVNTEHKVQNFMERLSRCMSVEDFNAFQVECLNILESSQETTEQAIELEHRPLDFRFNPGALVVLTEAAIPGDIGVALSFGYEFLFPCECNGESMPEILAQLEKTVHDAIPEACQTEAFIDVFQILNRRSRFQYDQTIRWLKFISNRTETFFKKNPHLFATKSDKGGHTVVVEVKTYEDKLTSLLNDNNYVELDYDPLQGLIEKDILFFGALFTNEDTKKIFRGKPYYEPNTLCISKFYGLFKIHKQGTPLRPITSTINSPGYLLSKVFADMVDIVFPRTDHHIKNIYDFVKFVDGVSIEPDEVLVSFDVVSMYTSIPFDLVKTILMSRADVFSRCFGVDAEFLLNLIDYLLIDCMIFSALNKTFKQINGLPMGSCLSPVLARIVMDQVADSLLESVPHINFLKVYVDDTIAAIDKHHVDEALQVLNSFRPGQIKFTIELENEHASIHFLNLTLQREGDKIIRNFYRKYFYSGRLLNFYSSHKRTCVMGTAENFIQTVISLSDPIFYTQNRAVVEDTLRDNCFTEEAIMILMNRYYTYMRPVFSKCDKLNNNTSSTNVTDDKDERRGYKIFPHSICQGRDIKRVLCRLKAPKVILADSVRNTKVNSVRTRKTITPIEKRKNIILISECQCKKKAIVVKTCFNETGEIAKKKIITTFNKCSRNKHAYNKAQFRKGLFYDGQTSYLVRYIKRKYSKQLDFDKWESPNYRLAKLLK